VRGRVETSVICSHCGATTIVPFLPHLGRPVFCRPCFHRQSVEASHRPTGRESV
jgi:CxxC-x17-CxxC domain-containing protein